MSVRQMDKLKKSEDILLAQRKHEMENDARVGGAYYDAMVNKQDYELESEQENVRQFNDPNYMSAKRAKRELEIQSEATATDRYNDQTFIDAQRAQIADKARRQLSEARTALAMGTHRSEGLGELRRQWEAAFRNADGDELDALTNIIIKRYGSSGASGIAESLGSFRGINGNPNYQASLRTLQQTMNDNTAFASNMMSKASDAYLMISEAGMVGPNTYEDLSYFSTNNNVATAAKDWATASTATLRRAVNSGALSNRMIQQLLNSDDSTIKSGLLSEEGKINVLQAALYNRQHNPSGTGPNPPDNIASQEFERERANTQSENEIFVSHERDAERIGKTTLTVNRGSVIMGTPATTFEGYAPPAGFNTGGTAPVQNADGHWIYTDRSTGRRWNATAGRYERQPVTPPTPPTP